MDWKSAVTKDDGTVTIPERWLHLHYYEALNILFRMENALRVFVYVVLKNRFREKWPDTALQGTDEENSTVAAVAAKRIAQAKSFGYLGYANSGELTRIITSETYWELFKPYFKGKKEIIKTKLDEIGTVRNALAHFRPIKYDDIELIKQNVKHAFFGIEQYLAEMIRVDRVVPTNTAADWYRNLSTLGSGLCSVRLFQDRSDRWIKIEIEYACVLLKGGAAGAHRNFRVTKLVSPEIIKSFKKLASYQTFMTEGIPSVSMTKDNSPKFRKRVSFVFSKSSLVEGCVTIADEIKELLLKVEAETELVQQDNLARGSIIDTARVWSYLREEKDFSWWVTNTDDLRAEFGEDDPPEYWGEESVYLTDFVAGSQKYPWMPSDISKEENPFG